MIRSEQDPDDWLWSDATGASLRIEDYAVIGDTQTAALVGRNGSLDWMSIPRFDSCACFASLLGDRSNGRWSLAPAGFTRRSRRRYRGDSLILETEFETDEGVIRLVDFMPPRARDPDVVRIVEGVSGSVNVEMDLVIRFDYGSIVPWVQRVDGGIRATAGPDSLFLFTPVQTRGENLSTVANFRIEPGQQVPFVLIWHPSHEAAPHPVDALAAVEDTAQWWADWIGQATIDIDERWRPIVTRSLITLKALTYEPTGGVVAAATTSLPERIGGVRNWDYRFCWLRDATFTLYSLMMCGFTDEALAWRNWLLRAVAGEPSKLQTMYGPAGERRLTELELDHLPGYENSAPVRIGNAASTQFQLDVWGEVLDAMHLTRRLGLADDASWDLQVALLAYLESAWHQPDEGIWEIRGPRRQFTHSKVMAWVAFQRGVAAVEEFGLAGPVDDWRRTRDAIHDQVCRQGFDPERNTFTQFYASRELDASLLMIPLVGFLPPDDPRVIGTIAAVQHTLSDDGGLLRRYDASEEAVDGLPPGEGSFLACSFWLVDNLMLTGRREEAEALFERLVGLANDVGLLSEQYDVAAGRQVGNFPQAFSHVSLVNSALNLCRGPEAPAAHRRRS